jgi:peroxiredoxin Q/BCP
MKKIFLTIIVVFALFLVAIKYNSQMKKIEVGDKVPTFTLKDQNGISVTINDVLGSPMVIYFYPKDDTPGCTKQACKFRDQYESFLNFDAKVIGISSDSVAAHKKFAAEYNLPFTLLADTEKKVRKLFGVPKSLLFLPGRVTYIIDKNGVVQFIFNSQFGIEKHIENALQKLETI